MRLTKLTSPWLLTTIVCLGMALGAQEKSTQLPPDHPPLPSADRRERLAGETAEFAPGAPLKTAPVPRKNLIDEHIFSKIERDAIPHAPLAGDTVFVRRLHLDLTGRIPSDDAARAFVASSDPDKRGRLIDKLITGEEWRERWTYWFLDLSRASQNRIGVPGRNLYHDYIYDALQVNQPFDELVRELITTDARSNWYVAPSNYLVRWAVFADNCTEIAHEDTADDMTVNLFKNFMGIDLQCVSCHDGANHLEKMSVWLTARKRKEFWAQSAFFGDTRVWRRVELRNTQDEYRIDTIPDYGYSAAAKSFVRVARFGEGEVAPDFILGGGGPKPGESRRQALARLMTSHRQFARATVNRFWAELMGVGIVEPVEGFDMARLGIDQPPPDGWDAQPTHPELLEALAVDFERSGYDLQHLARTIVSSSAYQLSTEFPGEWKASYAPYFARGFARRLTAEQVYDAIIKATDLTDGFDIPRTDRRVEYLVQTRGPHDLRVSPNLDRGYRKDLQFFVESFGQANREYNEPKRDGSIIQAALMMNSPIVKRKAKPLSGSFLARTLDRPGLTDEALIETLFWRFLTRPPDPREKDQALTLLADAGRERGGEDLQWLLMNKMEFLFNY